MKKAVPGPIKPKNGLFYLLIIALIVSAFYLIGDREASSAEKVTISEVAQDINENKVDTIEVVRNKINVKRIDGSEVFAYKEPAAAIYELLKQAGVNEDKMKKVQIEIVPTDSNDFWTNVLMSAIPFLLVIAFLIFIMRQAQSSNNQAISFGKSNAKLHDKEKEKTTFEDVAGAEEAKEELVEIVDFLKHPEKYTAIGAKIPKGVMLVGAPGVGKTLLARAVAGEAKVPFFSISGSEFVEMFVGVGASRVRDLFKKAKRNAPCIIFIDEIDAVGRHRGAGMGGGHDEREQTLNQILTEMDGFEKNASVIVMAATNRPDILDPALLRPGRFDRRIVVDSPSIKDRQAILEVHGRNKPLKDDVDLEKIAKQTPGFTGADLENLMNEAALLAARKDKKKVSMNHLEKAIEKVALGPEKKSRVLSKKEREITAFHEVGHAIVGHLSKYCDPVHKISIISRGMALGVTWYLPETDERMKSKNKFKDELASLLGGYVAEEFFFGDITTGASNDLEKATKIARRMVTTFGMSDLGRVIYGESNQEIFLGRDFGHTKNYSEEVAAKIDEYTNAFVDEAYNKAKDIITKNEALIRKIAAELLEKENLDREAFLAFFPKKTKKKATTKKKKVV